MGNQIAPSRSPLRDFLRTPLRARSSKKIEYVFYNLWCICYYGPGRTHAIAGGGIPNLGGFGCFLDPTTPAIGGGPFVNQSASGFIPIPSGVFPVTLDAWYWQGKPEITPPNVPSIITGRSTVYQNLPVVRYNSIFGPNPSGPGGWEDGGVTDPFPATLPPIPTTPVTASASASSINGFAANGWTDVADVDYLFYQSNIAPSSTYYYDGACYTVPITPSTDLTQFLRNWNVIPGVSPPAPGSEWSFFNLFYRVSRFYGYWPGTINFADIVASLPDLTDSLQSDYSGAMSSVQALLLDLVAQTFTFQNN